MVRFAYEHNINIIPARGRYWRNRGCIAVEGGIVFDLSRWREIVEIDVNNMQVVVRPAASYMPT